MRIRDIIEEKGMTTKEVAEKMDISLSALNQHLSGNPSVKILTKISEILNVPMWQLFVSPDEVNPKEGTIGIIRHNGKTYEINSISDIERSLSEIKGEGFMPDHKNIRGKNYFK